MRSDADRPSRVPAALRVGASEVFASCRSSCLLVTNLQQQVAKMRGHLHLSGNMDFMTTYRAPRLVFSRGRRIRRPDDQHAVAAMQALGQDSRLAIFRLLLQAEPDGLAVGAIAERLEAPQSTVSAHLSVLSRAQLVLSTRRSRSVCYRADLEGIQWLVTYLLADCCGGDPAKCEAIGTLLREVCCPLAARSVRRARAKS